MRMVRAIHRPWVIRHILQWVALGYTEMTAGFVLSAILCGQAVHHDAGQS